MPVSIIGFIIIWRQVDRLRDRMPDSTPGTRAYAETLVGYCIPNLCILGDELATTENTGLRNLAIPTSMIIEK